MPLLFNCALEYDFRRVQVNQEGWKLSGTHQLVAYADVNIWVEAYIIKKNTKTSLVTSKETGLEVNAENTKNTAMTQHLHVGQITT